MTGCINSVRLEEGAGTAQKGRFCAAGRQRDRRTYRAFSASCNVRGAQPEILPPRRWPLKFAKSARVVSYASPRLLSLWA